MQNGYQLEERDYFKEPFTEAELRDLVSAAGEPGVSAIFASRSPSLKKLGLNAAELSDERKISLMLEEPRLLRRPIIRLGHRLIIGASLKAIAEAIDA